MWFAVSTVIAYHIGILDQNPMLGTFPCAIAKKKYGYSSILLVYVVSTFCLLLFCTSNWGAEFHDQKFKTVPNLLPDLNQTVIIY